MSIARAFNTMLPWQPAGLQKTLASMEEGDRGVLEPSLPAGGGGMGSAQTPAATMQGSWSTQAAGVDGDIRNMSYAEIMDRKVASL